MTLLIASVFADTADHLERAASASLRAGADRVEARIDEFQDDSSCLNQLLQRRIDLPCLVTCRSHAEGGFFAGDGANAAMRTLAAVEGTGAWIDMEFAAWRGNGELRRKCESHLSTHPSIRLILSAHFCDSAPADLTNLIDEMLREGPNVIAKVAYAGTHIADSFHALDLMHRYSSRVVAICMGEVGTWTRVLAKKLGAFATFASLGPPTADGQLNVKDLRKNYGWDQIDADTKVFGVVGDPIAHSLSPRLVNHWFKEYERNAVYVPLRIGRDRGGLSEFLVQVEQRPWIQLSGLSITIPHKIEALLWAGQAADPMSREIGAANTLVLGDAGPAAYNTDCYAAVDSMAAALGCGRNELAGITVDVLGAGGAARAVCYGLAEMGCRVTVFARSLRNVNDFERSGLVVRDWTRRLESSGEVLVNCTPVGMLPLIDESPMPAEVLRGRRLVFDLIYRPLKTKLLRDAAAAGCAALGGLDMFVRQAAIQFTLRMGASPDIPSARAWLERILGREGGRKPNIALIGARGSGKTTVGALLAKELGVPLVDTDELVAATSGQTIAQIFEAEGEAGFRRREREEIMRALLWRAAVISVGGGAVLDPGNAEAIRCAAHVVWLAAPAEVLSRRVAGDPKSDAQRPPLSSGDAASEMETVLRNREALYRAAADFIVDTSTLSAAEVAQRIASWFEQHSSLRSE